MCIGIPMRVIEARTGTALCDAGDHVRTVDMRLVGDQPEGTWVLVFLDAAREVVTPEQAALVSDALKALDLAMSGAATSADIDLLFPDLAGRTPELPAHLKPLTRN